jgi:Tol biopolymer transport system component
MSLRRSKPAASLRVAALHLCLAAPAFPQVTERVSLGPGGSQANANSLLPPPGMFVSADGRFIAFASAADNLVPSDTNLRWDVFVHDRLLASTERVSVDSGGAQSDGGSGIFGICMSPDARFVAFECEATNLVPGDSNQAADILVRDRVLGTTERVSLTHSGGQSNGSSFYPSITPDGRFVAFMSSASNLVSGDTNGYWDVFVRDRLSGTTVIVSSGVSGVNSNGDVVQLPSLTPDGRFVAFCSYATNLVASDTNGQPDVFLRDTWSGVTEIVSLDSAGIQGSSWSTSPAISANGTVVAFMSAATNLVPGDTNGVWDVFVRDRVHHTTEFASISDTGVAGDFASRDPSISADGRYVAFTSGATNLCNGDTNAAFDGFVRDRRLCTTERVTVSTSGQQPSSHAEEACVSADGRYVAFVSSSPGLVAGDTNATEDIFLRDRLATGFTSICEPGRAGVFSCPCGNPPSGGGRGCDNSSATGGASLTATGIAYLSLDSLAFTTADEKPTATSILLEGALLVPNGAIFGQGVRCAGGALKRMYVKTAFNGGMVAPDIVAGDLPVSARSAQLGALIQPGQPCYFLVYYRDPIVLGACAATSTFNATQTGAVTYWP